MEIAHGIHRIESSLGVRFMAQYVLAGSERTMLFDTGMPDTPAEALAPYLESIGLGLGAVDDVLISHADLDHSGGNRALRELHPRARFACHELDRRWIESNDAMVAENYLWHERYGFDEPDDGRPRGAEGAVRRRRADRRGAPRRGDDPARGRTGGSRSCTCPVTRFGHIGLWDPRSRAAIVIDAVLERGIYANDGELLIPAAIYDVAAYRETIRRIRALEPDLLLTAHYPVMDAAEAP